MTPALSLVIDHTPDAVRAEALAWPDRAAALAIVDDGSYRSAADMLIGIKSLRTAIAATFDAHIARAYQSHKALVKEKADAEAPLTQAETTIKRALVTYTEAQERIRQAEERRLAEIARQAEEDRRMAEAAALEAEALATDDADMLATAQEIIAAPVATPVVVLPTSTPVVSGISYREVWRFRIIDPALVPREYLAIDDTKIGAVVRAMKGGTSIAGVQAYPERIASASGR